MRDMKRTAFSTSGYRRSWAALAAPEEASSIARRKR
jgi:hypothetical protein